MSANIPIGELFSIEKGSLQSSKCTPGEYDFITASSEWKTHNEFDHEGEYLIFAAAASGSLGRVHYVNGKFISSDLCYILKPKNSDKYPLNLHFYHFVFNSLRSALVADTKSGTSKESINQKNFKKYKLPYFNIAQQDFWIDKLKNTLDIKNNFSNQISNQQNLLKKLRQQILQDAIEGKLTKDWREQNPDVEPASELLKRIEVEKQQLIKDKKIKKQKPLPAITDDEKLFNNDSIIWCRLSDIFIIEKGQTGIKKAVPGEYPLVVTAEERLTNNSYQIDGEAVIIPMVSSTGHGHASLKRIHYQNGRFALGSILSALKPINSSLIHAKVYHAYLSTYKDEVIVKKMTGAANVSLTMGALSEIVVPLISKNNQEKLSQALEIIDQLEAQISNSKNNAEQLMQSVLKEAFSQASAA